MESLTKWVNLLAAIYVSIPIIVAFCILIFYFFGKTMTRETLEKLLEFSKWYMVAVAIVFAAKILDASFADRETSIKEIAIYEKYATTILEADNLEKRWKLSEYFAAVTPSKPLRDRWVEYKSIIKPEYDKLIALNELEKNIVASNDTLNDKQRVDLLNIQQQKNALNIQLASSASTDDKWIIVFTADSNLKQAEYENTNLKKAGISDVVIVNKGRFFFNISQDYNTRNEASGELEAIRNKVRGDVYVTASSKFCNTKVNMGSYFTCQ
jgi:hypothetical protein